MPPYALILSGDSVSTSRDDGAVVPPIPVSKPQEFAVINSVSAGPRNVKFILFYFLNLSIAHYDKWRMRDINTIQLNMTMLLQHIFRCAQTQVDAPNETKIRLHGHHSRLPCGSFRVAKRRSNCQIRTGDSSRSAADASHR